MGLFTQCRCDGCGRTVPIQKAREERWLKVEVLHDILVEPDSLDFVYCSLACLVNDKMKERSEQCSSTNHD